ncbi:MAG: HDOD domain-containing protein [Syntrophobacteraceae bacterium]|nr:HDOD domain-containing protein [Syntrophobacteraceae bacterium]
MEISLFDEQEIRCLVSRVIDLPPLPTALQRLVEIIQSEMGSLNDLERVIRYDQGLAARVLRIANSTYYGSRGQIRTIARALVLIGFEQAKRVCLCALLMELFSSGKALDPADREILWKEAFATAKFAGEIASRRPWVTPEEAYVLGLLHDIGRLVMAVYLPQHYQAVRELARHRKIPSWYAETEYGLSHSMIGKWVAVKWSLPEVFQRVIEYHHQPGWTPSFRSEVKLIYLANVLAISRDLPELLSDQQTLQFCSDLFITEDEWNFYQARVDFIWPEVDQFWNLLS